MGIPVTFIRNRPHIVWSRLTVRIIILLNLGLTIGLRLGLVKVRNSAISLRCGRGSCLWQVRN